MHKTQAPWIPPLSEKKRNKKETPPNTKRQLGDNTMMSYQHAGNLKLTPVYPAARSGQ